MNKPCRSLLAASLLIAATNTSATAPNLLYSEDWSGDIDWNTFNLGASGPETYFIDGVATIGNGGNHDFDPFYFNVPTGLEVTGIGYTVFALNSDKPYNYSADDRFGLGMDAADPGVWGTWEIDVVQVLIDGTGGSSVSPGDMRLAAGSYEFNPYYWTSGNGYGSWTYAVTFELGAATISPVPVPAAVWLFGSGLFGLIAMVSVRKQDRKKP